MTKLTGLRGALMVVLSFVCCASYGAPITVVANGEFSSYFDPSSLLPISEPAPGTIFTLRFTYDDSSIATESTPPNEAWYSDAISSMTLTIGSETVGAFEENNSIRIRNDYLDPADNRFIDNWFGVTSDYAGPGTAYDLFFLTLSSTSSTSPLPPLTSEALVTPEWPGGWTVGQISYMVFLDTINPQTSETETEVLAAMVSNVTGITIVPIPAAFWFFGSALGLLGWMTRKTA